MTVNGAVPGGCTDESLPTSKSPLLNWERSGKGSRPLTQHLRTLPNSLQAVEILLSVLLDMAAVASGGHLWGCCEAAPLR